MESSSLLKAGARRAVPRRLRTSRTLFSYLFRGLLVNCLVAFLVLEAVQGIIFTLQATEGFSLDFLVIFPVLLRAFGQAVSYTLPIALLFGTGLLVGRLNADREITALRSFGFTSVQFLLPVAVLGFALSILSYFFNQEMVPRMRFANRNVGSLILEQLGYLGEGSNLQHVADGRSIWIYHYDGPRIEGVFLSLSGDGDGGPLSRRTLERVEAPSYPVYLFAERGIVFRGTGDMEGRVIVELYGVNIFFDNDFLAPDSPSDFMNRLRVEKIRWSPQIARKSPGIKDLTSGPLVIETEVRRLKYLAAIESGSKAIPEALEDYAYAVTEFHRRLSLSLTALTFPLASFLIGLFLRSQNRLLPFFLSISVVPSVYFVFELLGNILASRGIYPWATEHLGNAMLLLVTGTIFALTERGPR